MLTNKEIVRFINDDAFSELKKNARIGRDYYEGNHDIKKYRIFYFDSDGVIHEDKYRSNVKIPHPFFTEIVDQSVQYIFSGERFVKSDIPVLQNALDDYFNFNESFTQNLAELLTGCMVKGSEYFFMYRNSDAKISFQCVDSLSVTEVNAANSSDGNDYIIFSYVDYIGTQKKKIKRVQVWNKTQVGFFILQNDDLVTDHHYNINPRPHTLYTDSLDNTFFDDFGFIPFFRLDNNYKKSSDLFIIKDLIDDYDLMASSLSNNLIDFDMPLYAVSGFEGDSLDLLQQNLKTKKIIGLDEGGNVDIKTVDVPYQARLTKLELDEKNIYRFGMGLNIDSLRDSSATTNIAIKAAYSLLDLKCAKLESRLKQFLRNISQFVLDDINKKFNSAYSQDDIWFEFKHQIMSNALENAQIDRTAAQEKQIKIQTLLSLSDVTDHDTIIQSISSVLADDYPAFKGGDFYADDR